MAKLKTGRHTGAIKTARQAYRRMLRNRAMKRRMREAAKEFTLSLSKKDKAETPKLFSAAASVWDKAAKTGAVHWKAAARKKSRMAKASQKALAAA